MVDPNADIFDYGFIYILPYINRNFNFKSYIYKDWRYLQVLRDSKLSRDIRRMYVR